MGSIYSDYNFSNISFVDSYYNKIVVAYRYGYVYKAVSKGNYNKILDYIELIYEDGVTAIAYNNQKEFEFYKKVYNLPFNKLFKSTFFDYTGYCKNGSLVSTEYYEKSDKFRDFLKYKHTYYSNIKDLELKGEVCQLCSTKVYINKLGKIREESSFELHPSPLTSENLKILEYIVSKCNSTELVKLIKDKELKNLVNKYQKQIINIKKQKEIEEKKKIENGKKANKVKSFEEMTVEEIFYECFKKDQNDTLANSIEKNSNEKNVSSYGKKGEENVDYQIRWLGSNFYSITKDCLNKNNQNCILLKNSNYIDETQEFDHIVIGKHCVFLIETKYFKGEIYIEKNGNWIKNNNNERKGIISPVAQVDRHHQLLFSILKDIIPNETIHDIICIAHDASIIVGEENSPIPIVKVDMLNRYIKNIDNSSNENLDVDKIINTINSYKISSQD